MKIKTKSGFACNVNENKLKDWRFVTSSSKMAKSKDDIEIINELNYCLNFLLEEEQANKLVEHLAKNGGVADVNAVMTEYKEITQALSEQLKKSQSSQE